MSKPALQWCSILLLSLTGCLEQGVKVFNTEPQAAITYPSDGSKHVNGASLRARGAVSDPNDAFGDLQVTWTRGAEPICDDAEVDPTDGRTECSFTVDIDAPLLTLEVKDSRGAAASASIELEIVEPDLENTAPTCALTSPPTGSSGMQGATVIFEGTASDDFTATNQLRVDWSSDRSGTIGKNRPSSNGDTVLVYSNLPAGTHVITMTVTDEGGLNCSDFTVYTVEGPTDPPTDTDTSPTDTDTDTDTSPTDTDTSPTDTDTSPTDTDTSPTDTDTDTDPTDTSPTDTDPTDTDPTDTDTDKPLNCQTPPVYTRFTHSEGNLDFRRARYAPDGTYALILSAGARLYRYDPSGPTLSLVSSDASETWYNLRFSNDGTYALIGGHDSSGPVLYRYTTASGLQAVAPITGSPGMLYSGSRIRDLAQRPGSDIWAILSDDGGGSPGWMFMHQLDPDWGGSAHSWSAHGNVLGSQGGRSLDWGLDLGRPIALAVTNYTEVMYFDPAAPAGSQFTGNGNPGNISTGNLGKVLFDPVDRKVAWVMSWSSNGDLFAWEGQLRNGNTEQYHFDNLGAPYWTVHDTAASPDGIWKVSVGRNGAVWFSDSPWRPMDWSRWERHYLPNFDQPPWNGGTSDYMYESAWQPGTCSGIIVGDATSNMGLIVQFDLYSP